MLVVLKEELKKSGENDSDHDTSATDESQYCEKTSPKRSFRALKNRLHFFEKRLSIKEKGSYVVWKTEVRPLLHIRVPIFLHAVNDSKPVYRISNKHAALPRVKMNMTELDSEVGKKVSVEKETSSAHKTFRLNMGFNDGCDRMRKVIGFSGKYYRS